MNWLHELYQTYENCSSLAGKDDGKGNFLLPVGFMQVNIQIDCIIDCDGTMNSAFVIDKEQAQTMIPTTILSASRTSSPVAHPLFDKLTYIAKDLSMYSDKESRYELYKSQLQAWSQVQNAPKSLKVLYEYLEKGTLINDLVKRHILHLDSEGKLINKWGGDSKEKPSIFKVLNGTQEDALVRFTVLDEHHEGCRLWEDSTIHSSFLDYYLPQITQEDLCYISGKRVKITELHPAYLRFSGDSAKLISSQDNLGFKYRGRCLSATDALSIGYVESQKAHNALKWLIQRQGKVYDGLVTLTWGTSNPEVFAADDEFSKLFGRESEAECQTGDDYAIALRKAIDGYKTKRFLYPDENIVVMSLDAATKGRLAILYYQSMKGSDYMDRICHWYETCSWSAMPYYKSEKNSDKKQRVIGPGSPTITQILNTIYGKVDSDSIKKMKRNAKEKILHCIVDRGKLPKVFVNRIFQQFCKLTAIKNQSERAEFLAVGCAIMRKYYNDLETGKKERWKMELDMNNKEASYLWGRLLAYCVWIEKRALWISDIKERDTNGERFTRQFQLNPMKAWLRLNELLKPYKNKLRKKHRDKEVYELEKEVNEIMAELLELPHNDEPLNDCFMMSYCAQLNAFEKRYRKTNSEKEGVE